MIFCLQIAAMITPSKCLLFNFKSQKTKSCCTKPFYTIGFLITKAYIYIVSPAKSLSTSFHYYFSYLFFTLKD